MQAATLTIVQITSGRTAGMMFLLVSITPAVCTVLSLAVIPLAGLQATQKHLQAVESASANPVASSRGRSGGISSATPPAPAGL